MFIARISRGRSIKEFLLGVVLVPSAFSLVWFAVLGGSGIQMSLENADLDVSAMKDASRATYMLLSQLPWPAVTQSVALVLVFVFLVTSADSGTYVLGMFSSDGAAHPPRGQRLFWGTVLGVITVVTLLSGQGLAIMRTFAAAGAIPFLFIMIWQAWCLLRGLKREEKGTEDA